MPSVACHVCLIRTQTDGPQTTCESCVGRLLDKIAKLEEAHRTNVEVIINASRDIATQRARVSELEDTILLQRADDDISSSCGRNTEAVRIASEIGSRRGEEWSGATVEPRASLSPKRQDAKEK